MSFLSSLFGKHKRDTPDTFANTAEYQQSEIYQSMRSRVFEMSASALGLSVAPDQPIAVLMETGHSNGVSTLVCLAEGTVSVYLSSGGGVIGAGQHEPVREAAMSFLELASTLVTAMRPTDALPLPRPEHVRFYVVTDNGIRTAESPQEDLSDSRHPLSQLFLNGHNVLAAVRAHTPTQDGEVVNE